jgi:uncharacterized protein with PIN domain
VKFIVDGMLGKLTRWLRMLGQDVKYSTQYEDTELVAIAEKEHRVLLTRDTELFKRALSMAVDAFYVAGKTEAEKLAELAERFEFPLTIDIKRSRCPRCNAKILLTPKEQVSDKVKRNTFAHYSEFWECPNCAQVYWQGSHWKGISATLKEANKIRGL